VVITSKSTEDLERNHLTVVPAFPNFGQPGDALGMIALLCDALNLIRRWDRTVVTTQPPKFNYLVVLQPWRPM